MLQRARDPAELRQRRADPGDLGLPPLRLPGGSGRGEPAGTAADRALQDPPRLRARAALGRRRRGDPRRGAGEAARRDLTPADAVRRWTPPGPLLQGAAASFRSIIN
ncbi:Rod shape-determining protein MreC [Actinacidiphila cocklensis]|uniref:Rod shape-determining protein MreC n=1 Tax=Actinacidiphila cocklensis TaxID=887465 RepID=A0A9W4GQS5_9ACTN|nr:Rod shape-determining protein MreC [Actinacidiphila cocklensis]